MQQEDLICEIVRRVMVQAGNPVKQQDAGGAMLIHTASVKTKPFEGRGDVRLQDLTTLEEAPRMGASLMELLDGADFEWALTYDEYDYINTCGLAENHPAKYQYKLNLQKCSLFRQLFLCRRWCNSVINCYMKVPT